MHPRSTIRGHAALVTGGTLGIGLATAERCLREGARVAVMGRNAARGAEALDCLRDAGERVMYLPGDAGRKADAVGAVARVLAAWGRLDILVNCAGGFLRAGPIEALDEPEWDAVIAWNLKSAFVCSQAAAPAMKSAGYGRIVNVSSIAGREGIAEASIPYGAAKAGMQGLTRRLAVELAPHGVTVNAVAPGIVLSPRAVEIHKERMRRVLAAVPMGRAGEAAEIADAIWYLATPGASYITGVTLDINGGRYMT